MNNKIKLILLTLSVLAFTLNISAQSLNISADSDDRGVIIVYNRTDKQ